MSAQLPRRLSNSRNGSQCLTRSPEIHEIDERHNQNEGVNQDSKGSARSCKIEGMDVGKTVGRCA